MFFLASLSSALGASELSMKPNFPLIALLGADGVGKSSVASALAKELGATIVKTPGPAYDGLRKAAEDMTPTARFMFYAASVAMSKKRILTGLRTNPVILDRYLQCTIAFHAAMGVEIPSSLGEKFGLPVPLLSVHLTVCPEEAKRRIALPERQDGSRPDQAIEADADLQLRVVQSYRKLASFGFNGTWLPVEIATDGKTPKEVAQEISALL